MAASTFGDKNEPQFGDLDAPDMAVNPTQAAAYAAKVGNNRVDTSAARITATGKDVWPGLRWFDTTTNAVYEWISGWVRRQVTRLGSGRYNAVGVLVGTPSWTDLITVTAVSTGGLCTADWNASIFNGASGANRSATFQVVCDGVLIWDTWRSDVPLATGSIGVGSSGHAESTPGAGTHTWKLQGNASVGTAVQVRNATLTILEI